MKLLLSLCSAAFFHSCLSAHSYYYDWQKHVPNWQQYIPKDNYDWQKHVPMNWQQFVPNWQQYVPNWQQFIPKGYSGNDWEKYIPHAQSSSVYYGPTQIYNEKKASMTIFGPAIIDFCQISGETEIEGPATINNSLLKTVYINGVATLENVNVENVLFINGPLYAHNSKLNAISIASQEMMVFGSLVGKIYVRRNDNDQYQLVYLKDGSKVQEIEFEARRGYVIIENDSFANSIIGGIIK